MVTRRETERLVTAIREALAAGAPAAMATVVRVRGSAYRREGTRMLVRNDGSYECSLSGSCLEPEIVERAQHVIATGNPLVVTYDLADDSLFGLGIGCTGAVDIRVERVESDDTILGEWLTALDRAQPAVLVTSLADDMPGRLVVPEHGRVIGSLGSDALDGLVTEHARRRLRDPHPESGSETIGRLEVFFEINVPPPVLVMFGAGHDAVPIADLAWTMGFAVTVVDARVAFLTDDRFPHATRVAAHASELIGTMRMAPQAFVLILNHNLERDEASLRVALESRANYIGLLGPRKRYEKLLALLEDDGVMPPADVLSHVHSPVGLSIGAETPDEVAVSIMSEILAVQRGFEGGSLNGRTSSLHRSEARRALARS